MKKEHLKKLSKEELEWAIYIVTKDKTLSVQEMQAKIKKVFKTFVPLWEINLHLTNRNEENFGVEHRKMQYGYNYD